MPFKTKICGVTHVDDAKLIEDSGAEAIGLNFYDRSKRYVNVSEARQIANGVSTNLKRVGVFVNASSDVIRETYEAVELDFVQLHGDEPPVFLDSLDGIRVIKAFRCKSGLQPVFDFLAQCKCPPEAILVDAYDPNEYGGTGKSLHWPDVAAAKESLGDIPLILAGGLTPNNIAKAISQALPFGVDTASGVELSPPPEAGPPRKDDRLVTAFVAEANRALEVLADSAR